ncbi:MAG TPA: hypothetical protein VGK10_19545 [Prolixibacteraceae bacterium]|jgi:hypothetical protein
MHLLKIYDILSGRRIVFAFFVAFAFISFSGCNQTNDCTDKARCELLDSIETQMFQQTENLESMLGKVDTTNMTSFDQARIRTIRGFIQFNNEEYDKSIKELEKAENFFLNQHDDYHLNICKLIKAFTFEYLNLDQNAASLYVECENYFNINHQDKFKFYASLGLFRMSKQLKLDEKVLIDRLKKAVLQFNDPNYNGLLHATLGVSEKNDSLKSIYYKQAITDNSIVHRWSRVYAIELNSLIVRITHDPSEGTQLYYENFNNRDYLYIPTARQKMRYKYLQAYLYAKQGKDKQSIEVAHQVLSEAMELNIISVETECVKLLANVYKRTSDFKNAHTMLERYHSLQKEDLDALQQNQMLALGAHYRYSEMEREKLELKVQVQRSFLIIGAICLILIFAFFIVRFLLKESRYKQEILKLKNMEIEDQFSNLLVSLNNEENRNEELIIQMEEWKVQHNDSIKLSEFLMAIDQKRIKTWIEFETSFRSLRPGWIEKLKKAVPELSLTDLKYCMCIYFNLENTVICDLCNVGIDAVKSGKKRIRNKFFLEDAKDINTFLNDFD